jgi:rRNA maturation endonuclease Nob1
MNVPMSFPDQCDGYISSIQIGNKVYKLKCTVVEAHPITCKKCGASFQLKYGEGQCEHCGTYYTTHFYIDEKEG